MTKTFRLETVLTISTGRMLCEIGEVYQILNHLTGTSLFTHQLPRAAEVCGPWLKIQFRELHYADMVESTLDCYLKSSGGNKADGCEKWVQSLKAGGMSSTYDVEPLPEGVYEHQDPIAELQRMMPDSRRIVVVEREG